MVACLERTNGNADFHDIVDFLTTSPIHYALTQIHATIDGKTVVISVDATVRSDIHFNYEYGITCLTNETIFEYLALMGYEEDSGGTRVVHLLVDLKYSSMAAAVNPRSIYEAVG
ncbi:hypothetical protein Tco_1228757 [Tanacetum coccineum]